MRACLPARRAERGETLIEIVVAVTIMGASIVVVVAALAAAVANATRQRTDAKAQTVLHSFAERARGVDFIPCATPGEYNARIGDPTVPAGYTPAVARVASWDGVGYSTVRSTLTGVAAAGDSTITVADATGFPDSGPYDIKLGSGSDPERATVNGGYGSATLQLDQPLAQRHEDLEEVTVCPPARVADALFQAQLLDVAVTGPTIPGASEAYTDSTSVAKRGPLRVPALSAVADVRPPTPPRAGTPVEIDFSATLDATAPTGDITFGVFGPDQYDPATETCGGTPLSPSPLRVAAGAAGTPQRLTFTPPHIGTYRWVASYEGDAANEGVTGVCGGGGQSIVAEQAQPTLSTFVQTPTVVPPSVALGGETTARAQLVGGAHPTGTMTFELHGPDDATCEGEAIAALTADVVDGHAVSPPSPPLGKSGTYRWQASYGGDTDNEAPPGKTACPRDADQIVTVEPPP